MTTRGGTFRVLWLGTRTLLPRVVRVAADEGATRDLR
jgi:hypothetical protein